MTTPTARLLDIHPTLRATLDGVATPARLVETLRQIADTPAPSQTASATRGAVVERLAAERGLLERGASYKRDAFGTGCDILQGGVRGVCFVAHLDEISYLLAGSGRGGRWPVKPYCYHLADGTRPAAVLRYRPPGAYHVVSHGRIGEADGLWYESADRVDLQAGDRIIPRALVDVEHGTGRVTGSLDNAAGVAAALLASEVLTELEVPYTLVLPDEEEGPAGTASQTISRGATRVFRHLPPADLTVVTDIHGLPDSAQAATADHRRPGGVSFPEFSSSARGSVTPPPLYRSLRTLFDDLEALGPVVRSNVDGYVPRSDDVVAMLYSPQVCLLGYPGTNRHFDTGLPTANVDDLVDLAKVLAVVGAAAAACLLGDRR